MSSACGWGHYHTYIVSSLHVTAFDLQADTISGVAELGDDVSVFACPSAAVSLDISPLMQAPVSGQQLFDPASYDSRTLNIAENTGFVTETTDNTGDLTWVNWSATSATDTLPVITEGAATAVSMSKNGSQPLLLLPCTPWLRILIC